MSKEAYKRQVMGEGATFLERKRAWVSCDECGVTMSASSLKNHVTSIHMSSLAQNWEAETWGG